MDSWGQFLGHIREEELAGLKDSGTCQQDLGVSMSRRSVAGMGHRNQAHNLLEINSQSSEICKKRSLQGASLPMETQTATDSKAPLTAAVTGHSCL